MKAWLVIRVLFPISYWQPDSFQVRLGALLARKGTLLQSATLCIWFVVLSFALFWRLLCQVLRGASVLGSPSRILAWPRLCRFGAILWFALLRRQDGTRVVEHKICILGRKHLGKCLRVYVDLTPRGHRCVAHHHTRCFGFFSFHLGGQEEPDGCARENNQDDDNDQSDDDGSSVTFVRKKNNYLC